MQQSFRRIAGEARELGQHPDRCLAHAPRNVWGKSAKHFHVPSDPQADGSTSGFDLTFNPRYGNGTSGISLTFISWNITDIKLVGGQNTSSARQASSGSGAGTSSGNASRQSNPGAQRDNSSWNNASTHGQNTRTGTWNGRN
ncbi:uncharacterized protein EAF02_009742 [Botrytis sinoallii]|uniref:uncharacterized protein n=1 Tax=Botrytis sinoallii TaxID=1463999 RepID=UPI001901BBAF|nr:uncharacterized protein EAF02_009742 [Botrytis sinoallii]KAF7867551.1 hypothetical protein EAF02_009742 [Botrytis sinoallii]